MLNRPTRKTNEQFKKELNDIFGNEYDLSKVNYINNKTKEIKKEFKLIHDIRFDYSQVVYINCETPVKIICSIHGMFEQIPKDHLNSNGCVKCSGRLVFNLEDFKNQANKVHNNFFNYDKSIYLNSTSKIIINCPKHGDFSMLPNNHLQGQKCPKCSPNRNRYTTEEYVEKLKLSHDNYYKYPNTIYKGAFNKIEIECPKHGTFFQGAKDHLDGKGCSKCKRSRGEIKVEKVLNKYNLKYETQKKFDGCVYKQPLKFDFYLSDYNICIEYDGIFHFELNRKLTEEDLKNNKLRDEIKNEYCKNNNINLLRIKYGQDKNIEDIIKLHLSI